MKTNKRAIAKQIFAAAMDKLGFEKVVDQSSFTRYDLGDGKRVYVAKSDLVTRVDFSGFIPLLADNALIDVSDNGRVLKGLSFSAEHEAAAIVENFVEAVKSADIADALPKTTKKRGAKVADPAEVAELMAKLDELV